MTVRYHSARLPRIELLRPELGLWGGLLLLLSTVFMSSAQFAPALPAVQLATSTNDCWRLPPTQFIFSLDAQKRLYMHASTSELQTKAIGLLAQEYNLELSTGQLEQLQQLPYLGSDIRQLPNWLATPSWEQKKPTQGIPYSAPNDQLTVLLRIVNRAAYAIHNHRAIICLRLDARLPAATVMPFLHQFQRQGINRFILVAEVEQARYAPPSGY